MIAFEFKNPRICDVGAPDPFKCLRISIVKQRFVLTNCLSANRKSAETGNPDK